jgi:RecA-family ATPase
MTSPAFTIAADVKVRPVEWLWYPFVPLGKLTAVAGRMGQGKTLWTDWLAAAVTTGYGINSPRPGGVVMLSAEDDDADMIVPRLVAVGADLSRVALIPGTILDPGVILAACEQVDARLLTIDPFTSYVPGNKNAYRAQDVRLVLAPIVELARARRLAAIAVQHVNRSDATDALDRIADSQGLPQVARSVLVWGADPQDEHGDLGSRKVLTRPKANLAPSSASTAAAFEMTTVQVPGAGTQPRLVHHGESDARADDVVQTSEARTRSARPACS